MKIEAIRVENGFLIPSNETLAHIKDDKVLLDVEIIDEKKSQSHYTALDQIVGFCESHRTDASIHHDEIVYNQDGNS